MVWSSCTSTSFPGVSIAPQAETAGSRPPEITVDAFSITFPNFRFEPLTLAVAPGDRIALLGPNGAGKSTLIRALGGRLPHYEGSIRVDGAEVRELLPEYRRRVGLLPEELIGTPSAKVGERLALLAAFHPSWDPEYAAELLSALELSADAHIGALSKGMKLKFSFVAAEAYRPPILLLDEPTSGLDPVVRRTFLALLREILDREPQRTLLFSTHILEDVDAFADRVWVLRNGRMTEDASVSDLHSRSGDGGLSSILYDAIDQPRGD